MNIFKGECEDSSIQQTRGLHTQLAVEVASCAKTVRAHRSINRPQARGQSRKGAPHFEKSFWSFAWGITCGNFGGREAQWFL